MKAVITMLCLVLPGAVIPEKTDESETDSAGTAPEIATILPGQMDFEREVKSANERYERAQLRYEEATERARLNYVRILEDNLSDFTDEDPRAAEYREELARVRSLKFPAAQFQYTTYHWEHNAPPVRMIHSSEGFCYIASFGGAFDGGAEVARVYIDDDGYWYLHGSTGNGFLVVTAMAVKTGR